MSNNMRLCLMLCLIGAAFTARNRMFDEILEKEANDLSNICTNGADPMKLSNRAYLAQFAAGPCSPVMLLPGILGSALRVSIDCVKLRQADPSTFGICGWSSCPGDSHYTLESSPKVEYQVWVSDVLSPMSIVEPTEHTRVCFGEMMQLTFDTSTGKVLPLNKTGVSFSVKGFTPETLNYAGSECGTQGIEDLITGAIDPEMTQYMKQIVNRLKLMGYKSGMTMQALPYDFRQNTGNDLASKGFGRIAKKLKAFTNKKVVVFAHSMGNYKTLYGLWEMSQQDKDDTFAMWGAIAPPILGATKPVGYLTCGSNEYFKFGFGLDMRTFKLSIGSMTSMYQLTPSMTYLSEAGKPWMQKIVDRIKYESGQSADPVFNWMPAKDQTCYPNFNSKSCRSGLEMYDNFGDYQGTPITPKNLRQWITDHGYADSKVSQGIWSLMDDRFDSLPNPGVPMSLLYAQVVGTEGKYSFKVDPKIASSANRFCTNQEESWSNWRGDGTVPSTAAVTAALKWADEFDSKMAGAKPVKIVDVCSAINVKYTPYDTMDPNKPSQVTKNEYIGLPCDCTEGKIRHCSHESLLFLPQLLDFVGNTVMTNVRTTISDMASAMTDQQLADFQSKCNILYSVFESLDLTSDNLRSPLGKTE